MRFGHVPVHKEDVQEFGDKEGKPLLDGRRLQQQMRAAGQVSMLRPAEIPVQCEPVRCARHPGVVQAGGVFRNGGRGLFEAGGKVSYSLFEGAMERSRADTENEHGEKSMDKELCADHMVLLI